MEFALIDFFLQNHGVEAGGETGRRKDSEFTGLGQSGQLGSKFAAKKMRKHCEVHEVTKKCRSNSCRPCYAPYPLVALRFRHDYLPLLSPTHPYALSPSSSKTVVLAPLSRSASASPPRIFWWCTRIAGPDTFSLVELPRSGNGYADF